jgi:hypothetical protein
MLAAAAVIGLVIVVGAAVNSGTTAAPPTPIIRQILRRKDLRKLQASANEIVELRKKVQEKEKRTLKTREFKDMPLKFHVIRNLESETWYKDLQIEVKNIGTKPIYGILAFLEFPDHKPFNRDIALDLTYGDPKYWDIEVLADSRDLHLDPGQTYIFTIPAKAAKTLGKQHERAPQEFKKLDFHFNVISFGDGTGFQAGSPVDLRKTKPDGAGYKKHHVRTSSYSRVRSPPQDGCLSCGRYGIQGLYTCFDLYINEWCSPALPYK